MDVEIKHIEENIIDGSLKRWGTEKLRNTMQQVWTEEDDKRYSTHLERQFVKLRDIHLSLAHRLEWLHLPEEPVMEEMIDVLRYMQRVFSGALFGLYVEIRGTNDGRLNGMVSNQLPSTAFLINHKISKMDLFEDEFNEANFQPLIVQLMKSDYAYKYGYNKRRFEDPRMYA